MTVVSEYHRFPKDHILIVVVSCTVFVIVICASFWTFSYQSSGLCFFSPPKRFILYFKGFVLFPFPANVVLSMFALHTGQ